jgi:hypothetical protein
LFDSLRLIAARLVIAHEFEVHRYRPTQRGHRPAQNQSL